MSSLNLNMVHVAVFMIDGKEMIRGHFPTKFFPAGWRYVGEVDITRIMKILRKNRKDVLETLNLDWRGGDKKRFSKIYAGRPLCLPAVDMNSHKIIEGVLPRPGHGVKIWSE